MLKEKAYCPTCEKVTECEILDNNNLKCSICSNEIYYNVFKNQMTVLDFMKLFDLLKSVSNDSFVKYISPVIDNRTRLIHCVNIQTIFGEDVSISTVNENKYHRFNLFDRCFHYFNTGEFLKNE